MNPKSNQLLEQLSQVHYQVLQPHLQLVSLEEGEQIYGPGDRIEQAFFPVNALLAMANELRQGVSIDMALVGSEAAEGLRGLYYSTSPYRIRVAHSGLVYRAPLQSLRSLGQTCAWLHHLYLQASQQILGQIATEVACAHFHCISARVARWLLTRLDRTGQPWIEATHQTLADALGVRREAITHALIKLPGIAHGRNRIDIQDVAALAQQSCDCQRTLQENLTGQLTLPLEQQAPWG